MLLSLRSKLWGTRTQQSVTGTGASTQSAQTNSGNCRWYSALTHKTVYLGTTIKKLIESDEPLLIPSIAGEGASTQERQYDNALAELQFAAFAETLQAAQRSKAFGYVIQPVSGSGATSQEIGWSTAQVEQIDVELEVLAAILAAA